MDFLGRIRKLDSSLQRGLDNGFARVFGGMVVPNELEECLKQEIDDFLMQDVDGRSLAPNDFRIGVSPKDFANLRDNEPTLPKDLANRMSRYCRNNGWSLSGAVSVRLELVDSLHTGQLKTASSFLEGFRDLSGFVGDGDDARAGTPSPVTPSGGIPAAGAADDSPAPDARGTQGVDVPPPYEADGGAAGAAGAAGAGVGAPRDDAPVGPGDEAWADADFAVPETLDSPADPNAPTQMSVQPPAPRRIDPEPSATARLLLQDGSSRVFDLRPGSTIIGRGTASDFRLPDTGVSRQHAEITWDGREATLTDLRSTNGTMVNDTPVESWLLADGDIISMGHSLMEFRQG